jgi:hypothetical protein
MPWVPFLLLLIGLVFATGCPTGAAGLIPDDQLDAIGLDSVWQRGTVSQVVWFTSKLNAAVYTAYYDGLEKVGAGDVDFGARERCVHVERESPRFPDEAQLAAWFTAQDEDTIISEFNKRKFQVGVHKVDPQRITYYVLPGLGGGGGQKPVDTFGLRVRVNVCW